MPDLQSRPPQPTGPSASHWRLGPVACDLVAGTVTGDGCTTRLDRGSQAVLARLLRAPGQTVSKAELLQAGWPGRVVTENSLSKAITRLRQALTDEDGSVIASVHGYGYRVTGACPEPAGHARTEAADALPATGAAATPALGLAAPGPAAPGAVATQATRRTGGSPLLALLLGLLLILAWRGRESGTPALAHTPPQSVLLMPTRCACSSEADWQLARGMQLAISDLLARQPELVLTSPEELPVTLGSTPDLRTLGQVYHVQRVLLLHLQVQGKQLRATLQLHETASARLLWSTAAEQPLEQLFELQEQLQREVLAPLGLDQRAGDEALQPIRGTHDLAAYREFLTGSSLYRSDDGSARRALMAFRRAVALDPGYDLAWMRIADILGHNGFYADSPEEALAGKREALSILDAVLQRSPRTIDAWVTRGALRYSHWWDWHGAEADFRQADILGGGQQYTLALNRARVAAALGRYEQALVHARRADTLQPRWQAGASLEGYLLLATGRIAEARQALARAVAANAMDEHARYYLGLCALFEQRYDEAREHFENSAHVLRLTGLAALAERMGDPAAAHRTLALIEQRYAPVDAFRVAQVHAFRGASDAAFTWLDRAIDQHEASLMYLRFDPLLAPIRSDPRFGQVLRRVGLAP